jgi:hypothetical protein
MVAVIADDNRVRFRVRQVSVLSNLYWSFVHDAAKPDLIVPEPLWTDHFFVGAVLRVE